MDQKRHKKPIYKQLSAELRSALQEGRFGDGERVPTEAELRQKYGVSRHTIRQAFQDLVAEGVVHRVPGRGTFVTGLSRRGRYLRSISKIEELMSWTDTEIEVIQPVETRADTEAASRLGLSSEEVAVLVVRRLYQGVPFVVTHIYLPPEAGKRLKNGALPSGTVLGALERFTPLPIAGASQDITAVSAPPELSAAIDCQPGETILYVERTYFDANGDPMELAISHYNPRRYSYRLELRRRMS